MYQRLAQPASVYREGDVIPADGMTLAQIQDFLVDQYAKNEADRVSRGLGSLPRQIEDGLMVQNRHQDVLNPEYQPRRPLTIDDLRRIMGRR